MEVAIHGKHFKEKGADVVKSIFNLLQAEGVNVKVSSKFKKILKSDGWENSYEIYENSDCSPDFMVSLGGDGTLLESLTHFGPSQIPILGINIGRLGYLATTSVDGIEEAVKALLTGNYEIDERILLHLDSGENNLFDGMNFALNDFTILKSSSSSMIAVNAFVDGEFLNTYWADGLIIATPTGSTGYSLSCGGPIVMPHSNNFIITPVAPHNLTIRPLVLSDSSEITLEIGGRSRHALISLDSRNRIIRNGDRLTIKKEKFKAKLVKIKGYSNFETLRQKLSWGLDARN